MNTGHEGSLTTIHANTPRDGLSRLEAMCMQTGADLPIFAIREMISSAVNMIVQLSRFSDGSRKVTYITEMHGQKDGEIQSTDLFRYVQTGVDENGKVQGLFAPTGNLPTFYEEFAAKGQPVEEDVFHKNAVPLDENGEPDREAIRKLVASMQGKAAQSAPVRDVPTAPAAAAKQPAAPSAPVSGVSPEAPSVPAKTAEVQNTPAVPAAPRPPVPQAPAAPQIPQPPRGNVPPQA